MNATLEKIKHVYANESAQRGLTRLYTQSKLNSMKNGKCGMEIGAERERDQYALLKLFLPDITLSISNDVPEDFLLDGEKISSKHSSAKPGTTVKMKWTSDSVSVEKDIDAILHAPDDYYPSLLLTYIDKETDKTTVICVSSEENRNTIKTLGVDAFHVPKGNSRGIEYSREAMKQMIKNAYFITTFCHHDEAQHVLDPIERRMNELASMGIHGF